MNSELCFRWLGVAGIELTYRDQVLLIDPFLSRPPFRNVVWGRPSPNQELLTRHIPRADSILVSHPHYDHLMDVPAIARQTGAVVYGSANTCRIASLLDLPYAQIHQIAFGSSLKLGDFQVEVYRSSHIRTPVDGWINGQLSQDLYPPLRLRDYRMDCCFAFLVQVDGVRILFNKRSIPADILLFAPLRKVEAYARLLQHIQPRAVIPIHWDDFFYSLDQPLRPLRQPPKWLWRSLESLPPEAFKRQFETLAPQMKVHIPNLFEPIALEALT